MKKIPLNQARAMWAYSGLKAFQIITDTDDGDVLVDFLADIRHWCDLKSIDFDQALESANHHYEAELVEDADTMIEY